MAENVENVQHNSNENDESPEQPPQTDDSAVDQMELLSEQFNNYVLIAKAIISNLARPRDVEISTEILRQLQQHNDKNDYEIRRHNNVFFRYFLRILKRTAETQPYDCYNSWYKNKGDMSQPLSETRTWLEENKSYIAVKSLKDGSSIVYAAVAKNPAAGWQSGGLKILEQRGANCQK